mgnify:CR=1 FL=1
MAVGISKTNQSRSTISGNHPTTAMAQTSAEKYAKFIRKAKRARTNEDYLKYLGKAIKHLQKMEDEILEDDLIYERRAA